VSARGRIETALGGAEAYVLAREALPSDEEAWVVGGAVRDALLGREVTDVDVAVAGSATEVARRIARAAGGHPFELSGDFATWRVVAHDGSWKLDVAELRGHGIESDLALRDFSVNAIAVPLAGGEALDPTGGVADLEAGILRAASDSAFGDDPLRILRGARLGAALELLPDAPTVRLARASASRAAEPAGERQFAELAGMVSGPDPIWAFELLERFEATAAVLPELEALRGVEQSANHHLDTYDHTIEVLRRTLEVEAGLDRYAGAVAGQVADLLDGPLTDELTRRDGLRFAALLHDVGKPATRKQQDGWVSFKGHDAVGAEMIVALCRRLKTSRRLATHLAAMTRDHLVLGFMVRERPLPPRRIWDYLRRTGPQAVDTTLLTVADRMAAQGGGVPQAAIEGHLDLAREMLAAAVPWELEGPPVPLLRGDEIAAGLGIEPGPVLGQAVLELEGAQYSGQVGNREEALEYLRATHPSLTGQ